jgi:hypothetical protein
MAGKNDKLATEKGKVSKSRFWQVVLCQRTISRRNAKLELTSTTAAVTGSSASSFMRVDEGHQSDTERSPKKFQFSHHSSRNLQERIAPQQSAMQEREVKNSTTIDKEMFTSLNERVLVFFKQLVELSPNHLNCVLLDEQVGIVKVCDNKS